MNVRKGDIPPSTANSAAVPDSNLSTSGPSPASMTIGARTIALRRLVYQESSNVLPFTTGRAFLMTTECSAVMEELATPKPMPTIDIGVPSRNTPMKNPKVTMEHENRIRRDGREWRRKYEVQTVKGRTRPRATW